MPPLISASVHGGTLEANQRWANPQLPHSATVYWVPYSELICRHRLNWWLCSILIQLLGLLFLLLPFLSFPRRPIPTGQHFSSSDQQPSEQYWRCFLWSQVLLLCYSILSEVWVNWDLTPCHQCCVKWLINTEQETALALTNRAFSNQQCSWNVCPPIEPPLKGGLHLQLCDWAVCHLSLSTREQPNPSCPGIGKNM